MSLHQTDTFTPDNLVIGDDVLSKQITLLHGQNLVRGSVLGKKVTGGTITGTATTGNTGNGTIGSLSVFGDVKAGVYRATCIAGATNSGTFKVTDPNGAYIGNAIVAEAFAWEVGFTIADGSADFIVGDSFAIAVSALTEKHLLSVATATDGSQYPDVILVEDTDATDGDITTVAYTEGEFNANHVTLGAGHTLASVTEQLRAKDIHLVSATA